MSEQEEEFINPIDPDTITDRPGHLPYPHSVGSPAFAPTSEGAIKHRAYRVMEEQCDMQMNQIREQIALLAKQAEQLKQCINISKAVYGAEMNFSPLVGETYYLYARENDRFVLSMIANDEWGKRLPYKHYIAAVRLLSDHTWDVKDDPHAAPSVEVDQKSRFFSKR